jgi:hypothetical protein
MLDKIIIYATYIQCPGDLGGVGDVIFVDEKI